MTKLIIQSLKLTLVFTVVTGLAYPLLVTGIARALFRHEADGGLESRKGQIVGSALLAQKFESQRYFWPRPSACDFGTLPSGGSNLGPTSQTLRSNVLARIDAFRVAHSVPGSTAIPAEMVFQSGSGLDPHISPESALQQVHRVAGARNMPEGRLAGLVVQLTEPPQFGFLGEARVNVFLLNLAADRL